MVKPFMPDDSFALWIKFHQASLIQLPSQLPDKTGKALLEHFLTLILYVCKNVTSHPMTSTSVTRRNHCGSTKQTAGEDNQSDFIWHWQQLHKYWDSSGLSLQRTNN